MKTATRTLVKLGGVGGVGSALLLLAGSASAQMPPPPGPQYGAPPPAAWAPPPPERKTPDHDLWVGRLGLGWYGTRSIPNGNENGDAIGTPLVGMRIWLTSMLGIDGAVGFYTSSGSTTTDPGATSVDDRSRTSFALHGGLPLAIFNMTHYSFQITPEMDLGVSTGSLKTVASSTDYSGFLFQVGARAGAEVFFGFMGLPQLSLDASIGLFWAYRSGKTSPPGGSVTHNTSTLGTQQFNSPWEIFTQNIAARYYF